MTKTCAIWILSGVCAISVAAVAAQETKSVNDGVFTAEQAKRGEPVYKEQCAACHGDDLGGTGPMPALAGDDFIGAWKDKSVGELFEKTQTSMPASAPGTMTPEQTADVLAYMFMVAKYPTGGSELASKMDALSQIKIEPAK